MDFLTNLYSNDNFGIILFIVISILVLAFLIVLFFGKKDQKERKLAETKSLEVKNTLAEPAFTDDQPTIQLNIDPEVFGTPVPPVINEVEEVNPIESNEPVIPPIPIMEEQVNNSPVYHEWNEAIETPSKVEEPNSPPKIDFDALADSISKELESISAMEKEDTLKVEPEIYQENKIEATPIFSVREPEVEKTISVINESPQVEEPIDKSRYENQERPKIPSPNQFSSVFVSKKKEMEPKEVEIQKPIVEEPQVVVPPIAPAKPNIELPKTIDLPKLNNNTEPTKNTNIVFSSLENDIPSYPQNNENRM